jgi:hypothetical protein
MSTTAGYIRVYDTALALLSEIDTYESARFERSMADAGSFTIVLNYNPADAAGFKFSDYFVRGNYVTIGDDMRRCGIILEVSKDIGQGGKGSQKVTIKGREAKVLFGRRVVIPPGGSVNYESNISAEGTIKGVLTAQLGSGAVSARQMSILSIVASSGRGSTYKYSSRYKNLSDDIKTICESTGIGVSSTLGSGNIIVDVIVGVDRTAGQSTNPRAIISTEYDTLESATLTDSEVSYKNVVIAAGQGVGTARNVQQVYSGTEPTGTERRELFQDARDQADTSGIQSRAANVLEEKSVTKYIDAKALTYSQLVLGTDYDLGDYVTVEAYGESQDVQITKVSESWGFNKYDIGLTFNREYPEFPKQVNSFVQSQAQQGNNTEVNNLNTFTAAQTIIGQNTNATTATESYTKAALRIQTRSTSGYRLCLGPNSDDRPYLQSVQDTTGTTGDIVTQPFGGNLINYGYTKLGSDAPAIKMKKFTGTTGSTQGSSTLISHSLTGSKIISMTALVEYATNSNIPPGYNIVAGYEYQFESNALQINLTLSSSNSANILSKSFKVLITYEE